jgi:hypothetical protein
MLIRFILAASIGRSRGKFRRSKAKNTATSSSPAAEDPSRYEAVLTEAVASQIYTLQAVLFLNKGADFDINLRDIQDKLIKQILENKIFQVEQEPLASCTDSVGLDLTAVFNIVITVRLDTKSAT